MIFISKLMNIDDLHKNTEDAVFKNDFDAVKQIKKELQKIRKSPSLSIKEYEFR